MKAFDKIIQLKNHFDKIVKKQTRELKIRGLCDS